MQIALASDHAGYQTKKAIKSFLEGMGLAVTDMGPDNEDSVDYPDYALKVARGVAAGKFERGILICGTGLGMCITANKVRGIRAVTCHNEFTAEMSRRHNDANILCLGARVIAPEQIVPIVKVWVNTPFEAGRHSRRIQKITESESDDCCCK